MFPTCGRYVRGVCSSRASSARVFDRAIGSALSLLHASHAGRGIMYCEQCRLRARRVKCVGARPVQGLHTDGQSLKVIGPSFIERALPFSGARPLSLGSCALSERLSAR